MKTQTCPRRVAKQQQNTAATHWEVTPETETKRFRKVTGIGSRYGVFTGCSYQYYSQRGKLFAGRWTGNLHTRKLHLKVKRGIAVWLTQIQRAAKVFETQKLRKRGCILCLQMHV